MDFINILVVYRNDDIFMLEDIDCRRELFTRAACQLVRRVRSRCLVRHDAQVLEAVYFELHK